MVESEAKELNEDIMLGAVMFGHRHFQPVVNAIIELAEKAATEPRDVKIVDESVLETEMLGLIENRSARRLRHSGQAGPLRRGRQGQGKGDGAPTSRKARRPKYDKLRIAGVFKELEAKIVRWNIPRYRQAHRRPRFQDRPQTSLPKSAYCLVPTFGAVHPR